MFEQVSEYLRNGVDVAINAPRTNAGVEADCNWLRHNAGRLLFASHPPAGERIGTDPYDLIKGRTIWGSWAGASRLDDDTPVLARQFSEAGISLIVMMLRAYSLREVNAALDDLEPPREMQPVSDVRMGGQ